MQPNMVITQNAIQLLTQQVPRDITIQLINLKKMKTTNRLNCQLSDGLFKIRSYITDEKITQNDNLSYVKITSYGTLRQHERIVGIVVDACEILSRSDSILGQPLDFLKTVNGATNKVNKQNLGSTQKDKTKAQEDKNPIVATQRKQQNVTQTQNRQQHVNNNNGNINGSNGHATGIDRRTGPISYNPIQRTPDRTVRIPQSTGTQNCIQNYEKISDLYPDFPNWQILARLVKKNYRQFVSKSGKGKLTKVLNLQFLDSAGMRITGALFGDSAKQYYDALKQDNIYEVSKGQIREDQYNQNQVKNKNYSKYTIMFTKQSEFKRCPDSSLVPNYQSNLKNLLYISSNRNIGQQYDSVAILLKIHQQVQIPKDNKTLYKQVLQICDPENDLIMQAVVWNRGLKIDSRIQGKTIGLFGFRLNQFNQKLSLNSSYSSEIRILDDHKYKKYEGKVDRENMQVLSQKKQSTKQDIQQACKNLKQLQNQLVYLQQGKQIRSTLTLILTLISAKKWYYESCPYCRKSAQSSNRCSSCQKYVQQTAPRYKLNIQLSDYCGSIWATGFQQLGSKLFSDYNDGIKGLISLQENQRHRIFQKKQFQQFTVKLTSKLDRDGYVKHTVNRVYDCNIMNRIHENIKRIKNHL